MAEQYVSAYAIDADRFFSMVGSGDDTPVVAALGRMAELTASGVLLRATEATEVEPALREIIAGRLDPSRPGGYGWLLELLGRVHGTPLGSVVLPGRGWHQLEDVFRACGLTELSELWGRAWPFPWRTDLSDAGPWPFPMLVPHADLHRVQAELSGFETELLDAHHDLLPGGDDDVEDVSWLIEENLPVWVEAALTEGRDLLLLRDGGR